MGSLGWGWLGVVEGVNGSGVGRTSGGASQDSAAWALGHHLVELVADLLEVVCDLFSKLLVIAQVLGFDAADG